jgi:hypothetical protein
MGFDITGTGEGLPGEGEVLQHPIDPGIDIDVSRRERIEVISIRPNTSFQLGFFSCGLMFIQVRSWSFWLNKTELCLL